jgi:hypothetical protein
MRPRRGDRQRFEGTIAGLGSTGGTRVVLGHWPVSPFGSFADVMVERADGRRLLLAPTRQVAEFVEATYTFDEVRLVPVEVAVHAPVWRVSAGPLELSFTTGSRPPLGRLLRAVPPRLASSPAWATAVDPVARVVLQGVRTRGSAGGGRREWYGARDLHRIVSMHGSWDGADLGGLAPVDPPARFGFSSTPTRPSLTRVVSTVELPD